ncbi:MAG: type II toxin-antitoxin system HicB family antitoxin [Oscillospiraceae bacterium]|nr:type II toxin-antitoxin system HicB family antitoxin [Oscillospiraceae bacterium]
MKQGLTVEEFEKRLAAIPTVKPDAWDLQMLAEIKAENDTSPGVSLEEVHRLRMAREYSGKISLRVPKTLHMELKQAAKSEGISLNQFILYKLAK